jgi:hypothetical protein
MTHRISIAIATLSLSVLPTAVVMTLSDPAMGTVGTYYSSCDRLHRDFQYGVARSERAARKQVRDGYHKPAYGPRARSVYQTNHARLDRDGDGTACEA